MHTTTTCTRQLPDTAAWLLAAGLLLGLLGLGSLARPALAPAQGQARSRAAAPPAARVVPASWRAAAP
ncbi:MAG TPA: hypothetical protein VFO93_10660 [Hymenobacter sp.]|uniref:hypothetical protein n=1 Tax=Hymenobacter sp. TaxID=1898978 RepID=UPI002D7EEE88|nr:hypothetical protein [Hymenobacter sp.]HET9503995.1 hypothetical protein [Hymenobacter sp.]